MSKNVFICLKNLRKFPKQEDKAHQQIYQNMIIIIRQQPNQPFRLMPTYARRLSLFRLPSNWELVYLHKLTVKDFPSSLSSMHMTSYRQRRIRCHLKLGTRAVLLVLHCSCSVIAFICCSLNIVFFRFSSNCLISSLISKNRLLKVHYAGCTFRDETTISETQWVFRVSMHIYYLIFTSANNTNKHMAMTNWLWARWQKTTTIGMSHMALMQHNTILIWYSYLWGSWCGSISTSTQINTQHTQPAWQRYAHCVCQQIYDSCLTEPAKSLVIMA